MRMTAAQAKAHLRQAERHIAQVLSDPYITMDLNDSLNDVANELKYQINTLEAQWREPDEE